MYTRNKKIKDTDVNKSKFNECKNVKIVKKDDGKYIIEDRLEYKLKIKDDNTIINVDDDNEYKSLD